MPERRPSQSERRRHASTSSTSGINFYNHVSHVTKLAPSSIELQTYYERKSDKTVTTCGLQSKASLRRTDSGSHQMVEAQVQKEDFGIRLETTNVDLKPGDNTLVLKGKVRLEKVTRFTIDDLGECACADSLVYSSDSLYLTV